MEKNRRQIKLKIKDLIDELDPSLINAFIVQYASHDKSFEMAFKAHFISNIKETADEREKYRRLLDEMIKPKNAYNTINASQKKVISIVFRDLLLQMNDLLSTDNYTEAYYLGKECLDKMAYLKNRYRSWDNTIEACRVNILKGIELILEEELAPGFRKNMEDELKDLASRSYYIPGEYNLLEVLNGQNVLIREEKKQFIEDLIGKSDKSGNIHNILKTIIQLSHPFPDLASEIMMEYSHDHVFEAIKALIGDGKFNIVDFYIDNQEVEFCFNKELLNVFKWIEKDEHSEISKALNTFPNEKYSIIELKLLAEALPEIYLRKESEKISAWVESLPFGLASSIYARANKNEKLIEMLYEKDDVEWLKVYDKTLIDRDFMDDIQDLYNTLVINYMTNHIGKKTREYLDKIHQHLSAIEESGIYDKLYNKISDQFDHRISLSE